MSSASEQAIYLALGVALSGFIALLLLLGPVGWVFAVPLLAAAAWLAEQSGLLSGPSATRKVNCRECGARNPRERDACHYCGEPLREG